MFFHRALREAVVEYAPIETKVRAATSNDPWGPTGTEMREISDLTYKSEYYSTIMEVIMKRLHDEGKNWRRVYKTLVLLDYIFKTGCQKVALDCRDNIIVFQNLTRFEYHKDGKDQGTGIREKSRQLITLLYDSEKYNEERLRAVAAKRKLNPVHNPPQSHVTISTVSTRPVHRRSLTVGSPVNGYAGRVLESPGANHQLYSAATGKYRSEVRGQLYTFGAGKDCKKKVLNNSSQSSTVTSNSATTTATNVATRPTGSTNSATTGAIINATITATTGPTTTATAGFNSCKTEAVYKNVTSTVNEGLWKVNEENKAPTNTTQTDFTHEVSSRGRPDHQRVALGGEAMAQATLKLESIRTEEREKEKEILQKYRIPPPNPPTPRPLYTPTPSTPLPQQAEAAERGGMASQLAAELQLHKQLKQQLSTPKIPSQQIPNQQIPNQQMPNPQMSNQQLTNQQFTNQQRPNPQMSNQPFTNQQFTNPQMSNQQFTNPQMSNQQFTNQQMTNQQFTNQQMSNQPFTNQQMTNQQFTNQQFTNPQMSNQQFTNQQFTNPQMSNQQFTNQQMTNQQFTNQQMTSQQFTNQQLLNQQMTSQFLPNQHNIMPNYQMPNQYLTNQQLPNQHLSNQQLFNPQSPNQHLSNQQLPNPQSHNQHLTNQPIFHQPNQLFHNQQIPTHHMSNQQMFNYHTSNQQLPTKQTPNLQYCQQKQSDDKQYPEHQNFAPHERAEQEQEQGIGSQWIDRSLVAQTTVESSSNSRDPTVNPSYTASQWLADINSIINIHPRKNPGPSNDSVNKKLADNLSSGFPGSISSPEATTQSPVQQQIFLQPSTNQSWFTPGPQNGGYIQVVPVQYYMYQNGSTILPGSAVDHYTSAHHPYQPVTDSAVSPVYYSPAQLQYFSENQAIYQSDSVLNSSTPHGISTTAQQTSSPNIHHHYSTAGNQHH